MFGAGPRLKAARFNGPTDSVSLVGWVDLCPHRVPGVTVHKQDAEALETEVSATPPPSTFTHLLQTDCAVRL